MFTTEELPSWLFADSSSKGASALTKAAREVFRPGCVDGASGAVVEIDVGLVGGDRNDLERLFPLKRVVLLAT